MNEKMNEKNTVTLSKYLLTKGIYSPVKIQKMLFFFRVEELKSGNNFGYFNKSNNFQAWIYGPVNPESYFSLQKFFNEEDEQDAYYLSKSEVNEIDEIYGTWFNQYSKYTKEELIEKSHKNQAWINARANLGVQDPCRKFLEEDATFCEFIN